MLVLDVMKECMIETIEEDIDGCGEVGYELKISDLTSLANQITRATSVRAIAKLVEAYSGYDIDVHFWQLIEDLILE